MPQEPLVEYFVDGRKQRKYHCRVCGKLLHDTSQSSVQYASRDEISNLLCADCQKKANSEAD
jgi:hypothetical protein